MNINFQITISGYYGYGNTGDEAILHSILNSFKSLNNIPRVSLLYTDAKPDFEYPDISIINRKNYPEIYKTLRKTDLFISGGGGLLQDITGFKSIAYYLGLLKMAQSLRVPTMIYAQGIGPILTKRGKWLTQNVINKTSLITLRDTASIDILKSYNIKNDIHLTADPAFLLEKASCDKINEILKEENIRSPIDITISPRPWKEETDSLIKSFSTFINKLHNKNKDINILLLPFQPSTDSEVCLKIFEACENKNNCYILKKLYKPAELMGIIGLSKINIAMRLHALIFSISTLIPSIAISYDPKVTQMAKTADSDIIDLKEISPEIIEEKLSNTQKHIYVKKEFLEKTRKTQIENALKNNQLLISNFMQQFNV